MPKAGLLAVVLVWAFVLYRSISVNMLWEDEAFNLTVVRNLVEGLGYTSDGMLSGNDLAPFDTRISTGPVILLPAALLHWLGVDLVFSGRIIAALFAAILVLGLYCVGARLHYGAAWSLGSRETRQSISWVGLIAALTPLAYDTRLTISPIQGPADVLGEFGAAACLVWALFWVQRRPWLAGLLVGLAIQCKFMAVLAVPAFVIGVLLYAGLRIGRRVRDTVIAGLCALAPTAAYELWVLLSLGWPGYRLHLREFRAFVQGVYASGTTVGQKIDLLSQAWFLPSVIVVLAVVLAAGFGAATLARAGWSTLRHASESKLITLTAFVGTAVFLSWWVTSSQTPLWVRHPAVGILAFVPVLVAALLALCVRQPISTGSASRRISLIVCVCASLLVVAQTAGYVRGIATFGDYTLDDQRHEATEISDALNDAGLAPDSTIAVQWGAPVGVALLTGYRLADIDGPEQTTETLYRVLAVQSADLCAAPPMVTTDHFIVCSPRDRSH